ncbi:MAG: hypothetical protein KGQ60_09435 [Planctomycetes bacterium]|nr:hypothetical protein [Planctomycetota bacterium]
MLNEFLRKITNDPKILAISGSLLFFLGMLSFLFGYWMKNENPDKVNLAFGTALLLSMGYPLMLYVGSIRRIDELEKRLLELEKKIKP